jgi:hypothetical protein
MTIVVGPSIASSLIFYIDAANPKSYQDGENLFLYSTNYNSGYWNTSGATTTLMTGITAPDGTNNGVYKLIGTPGNAGRKSVYQPVNVTSGTQYAYSVYMKAAEFTSTTMWFDTTAVSPGAYWGASALYDLTNGITSNPAHGTITNVGNGWYRCQVIATATITGPINLQTSQGDANGAGTPAGTGTSGVFLWGPQIEIKSSPSTYRPTGLTSSTRAINVFDLSSSQIVGKLNTSSYVSTNSGVFSFNGTSSYISTSINPTTSSQLTVEAWVNVQWVTTQTTAFIVGRSNSYRMIYAPSNFTWVCATSNNGWYTAGTAISINVQTTTTGWYQVVGVYNGVQNLLYLNGKLSVTGTNISGFVSGGANLQLMQSDALNVDYGSGYLSVCRIYNRGLSADEIQQNFNAMRGRYNL